MNENYEFIKSVAIDDIPWHRLTTAYGRAIDFPKYFDLLQGSDLLKSNSAEEQIASHIEHQSTLWAATPFAMIFLIRIFDKMISEKTKEANNSVILNLLDLFIEIAECCNMGNGMEHADPLLYFSDMLKEEYLWSEVYDEMEDEIRYEEGPFPSDLFYSFYYYSDMVLKSYKDILRKYSNDNDSEIIKKINHLLLLIK